MKIRVQIIIEQAGTATPVIEEVACLERGELNLETLGLTLAEAKTLLASLQEKMTFHQTAAYLAQQGPCPNCGRPRAHKGHHELVLRTLFGKLKLPSPRLYPCPCQPPQKRSFSPLAECLPERTSPELAYLQTKWAALMSYGLTVDLLEEVLPLQTNTTAIIRKTYQVAERLESELGEEQVSFIEGCPRAWDQLPRPDEPLTVGIDGGYIHAREGENRKAGWFEVIVCKSMPTQGQAKCCALVNGYDQKPKRRLFELLQSQGLQMNQTLTFLSDGGDTVRELQLYLSPQAEHLLDWFHITMRLTVLKQMVKGLPAGEPFNLLETELDRVKWFLWHGNVFMALQLLDDLCFDLDPVSEQTPAVTKLFQTLNAFRGYIAVNRAFIPNYGDRYHYGEVISTAFVESTVNQVISKRFVKKQQMRWTQRGAHLLLQVRTQVLNSDLRKTFCRWYPEMSPTDTPLSLAV